MIERNPASELSGPRLARRRPQSLTREDIQRLLAQPGGTSPAVLRDRHLCAITGFFGRPTRAASVGDGLP